MSAFDHLPLLDPTEYFNSPAVPDGEGVGYVGADGIIYDRDKKPVGRDKNHFQFGRLRQAIEGLDQGKVLQQGAPKPRREVVKLFEGPIMGAPVKIGLDSFGDCWVLEVASSGWRRLALANLPPLPQE
jgi:hypothetical protein